MKYVDLGLPSGKKWAKCNLGASSEEEYGLYYQWGDTVGYTKEQVLEEKKINCHDYKFSVDGSTKEYRKYNSKDGKNVVNIVDDAAYKELGDNWRIPTKEDFQELIDNTTTEIALINGVKGMKFISKNNGNYIFFPFAGYANSDSMYHIKSWFSCWASKLNSLNSVELNNNCAWALYGNNNGYTGLSGSYYRTSGRSIRGIYVEDENDGFRKAISKIIKEDYSRSLTFRDNFENVLYLSLCEDGLDGCKLNLLKSIIYDELEKHITTNYLFDFKGIVEKLNSYLIGQNIVSITEADGEYIISVKKIKSIETDGTKDGTIIKVSDVTSEIISDEEDDFGNKTSFSYDKDSQINLYSVFEDLECNRVKSCYQIISSNKVLE